MEQVSLQQAVDADPKTAYRALKEPVNLLVAQTSCRFGFISQAVVGRGSFGQVGLFSALTGAEWLAMVEKMSDEDRQWLAAQGFDSQEKLDAWAQLLDQLHGLRHGFCIKFEVADRNQETTKFEGKMKIWVRQASVAGHLAADTENAVTDEALLPFLPWPGLFIIMPVKCIQEPNVAMLMTVCEFCIGGSLEAIQDCIVPLQSSIRLTPQQRLDSFNFKDSARMKNSLVLYMFLHGGSLITLLQARQALYRDLKLANTVVQQVPGGIILKLLDYSLMRVYKETDTNMTISGTMPFMAPELLLGLRSDLSHKVDTFSLGITFTHMLYRNRTGKPLDYVIPWPGKKEREIHEYHVIVCGHLQAFYEACRPALGDDLTDAALHDIRASAQRLKVPLGPSDAPLAGHYHKLQELLTQLREVADKAPGPAERGEHKFASVCLQVMKATLPFHAKDRRHMSDLLYELCQDTEMLSLLPAGANQVVPFIARMCKGQALPMLPEVTVDLSSAKRAAAALAGSGAAAKATAGVSAAAGAQPQAQGVATAQRGSAAGGAAEGEAAAAEQPPPVFGPSWRVQQAMRKRIAADKRLLQSHAFALINEQPRGLNSLFRQPSFLDKVFKSCNILNVVDRNCNGPADAVVTSAKEQLATLLASARSKAVRDGYAVSNAYLEEEAEDKEDEELLEMVADAVRLGQQQYLDTLHEELSNGNAVGIVQAALQQAGATPDCIPPPSFYLKPAELLALDLPLLMSWFPSVAVSLNEVYKALIQQAGQPLPGQQPAAEAGAAAAGAGGAQAAAMPAAAAGMGAPAEPVAGAEGGAGAAGGTGAAGVPVGEQGQQGQVQLGGDDGYFIPQRTAFLDQLAGTLLSMLERRGLQAHRGGNAPQPTRLGTATLSSERAYVDELEAEEEGDWVEEEGDEKQEQEEEEGGTGGAGAPPASEVPEGEGPGEGQAAPRAPGAGLLGQAGGGEQVQIVQGRPKRPAAEAARSEQQQGYEGGDQQQQQQEEQESSDEGDGRAPKRRRC